MAQAIPDYVKKKGGNDWGDGGTGGIMVVGVEGNNRKAGGLFPRNCEEVVLEGLTRTQKYSDLHESRGRLWDFESVA